VSAARKELGLQGFVAPKKGTLLHTKATQIARRSRLDV
jgi:hypothetical protein